MYHLSHPVRRMRDDPIEGQRVTLLIEFEDSCGDVPDVESIVADADGELER